MSVPLDLSLIRQLLNEQHTEGDLNALTKPGFFYVVSPTNTPNEYDGWCHVINLVNYTYEHEPTEANMRIFQIYISDHKDINTVWYRQCSEGWTAWERFVTATDLSNSMSNKVNNSDLVADYYNKTDVDALINTINSALNSKANYDSCHKVVNVQIYDTTGAAHNENSVNAYAYSIGVIEDVSVAKRELSFTLHADYPDNTKLAKIAFSPSVFEHIDDGDSYNIAPIVPAMLTIKFTDSSPIVATLDTDNSDTEHFIYNVPTNLQNKTISKYTVFEVYFIQ